MQQSISVRSHETDVPVVRHEADPKQSHDIPDTALTLLFFVSGWSAILYELVWQRTLFAVVGINIEAVTLIVTEFMLGLGVGSLLGGRLSRAVRNTSLYWFAALELGIAAFGAVSLPLLRTVGGWTLQAPPVMMPTTTFALLALPTLAMGATLPLLVNYRVGRSGNVGYSVGSLYFVNTLGAAAAAYAAVVFLMGALGQQGVVWVAVGCNVLVASCAILLATRERNTR
jgi:predicted membrane-bound spermidine synthase